MHFLSKTEIYTCIENKHFARGGNSLVYKVTSQTESIYALKLFQQNADSQKRRERFAREISVMRDISFISGCIKVFDEGLYDDEPFFVMPLYQRGTFRHVFIDHHESDIRFILSMFLKVLQIVKEVHSVPIAVRDIKPQNILVDDSGAPVLSDFGLALQLEGDAERLTSTGEAVGSSGYAPPEALARYSSSTIDRTNFECKRACVSSSNSNFS